MSKDRPDERERTFTREYLLDFNASAAAERAGFPRSASRTAGWRMLKKASVLKEIKKEMDKRTKVAEATVDRVLKEMCDMAFYDPGDLADVKSPEDIKALDESVRRAITGWAYDKEGRLILKLSPKTPSLDQLGRYLKMFTDKLELSGNLELAERLREARERSRTRA